MSDDLENDFKPKLGRIRDVGKASGKRYVNRVMNAAGRMNPHFGKIRSGKAFTGRNIGRGTGAAMSARSQRFQQRRVVVKARFVKLAGDGFRKAAAHLRYVQRDGVSKEGEPGALYNDVSDKVDGEEFLKRGKQDRHQFRFIVSAEDAGELADMKALTRDLMAQAERDLDTKLDWVAVDHFNTDNPHTHIIVRGVDERGADLVIARDYISRGFRQRAQELVTAELGPRQEHEIQTAMRREIAQDRFTSIDRDLQRQTDDNGVLDVRGDPGAGYARFKQSLNLARLEKLEGMGLAEQVAVGRWRLADNMETNLRALGQRGDIIKMMHAEMRRLDRPTLAANYEIFRPDDQPDKRVIGQLVAKGLADEINDRFYLVVEGIDGKTHYAEIGQHPDIESLKPRSIVELTARQAAPRKVDRTIAEIAAKHNGLYSADLHAAHDPKASHEFIASHTRRLEALRRQKMVRRFSNGDWEIPGNHLSEIAAAEQRFAQRAPVNILTRSHVSLDVQASATGATWLDRTLLNPSKAPLANTGYGAEVTTALERRRIYLVAQGLADQKGGYRRGLLSELERRELEKAARAISDATGKTFAAFSKGDQIKGVYSRDLQLVSGRYALVEQSKEFNLVPWRSVLERARGKAVSGIVGGGGISWDIGRKKGIGIS